MRASQLDKEAGELREENGSLHEQVEALRASAAEGAKVQDPAPRSEACVLLQQRARRSGALACWHGSGETVLRRQRGTGNPLGHGASLRRAA